jgi:hypothetical protein
MKFDTYVCVGDSITIEKGAFTVRVHLEFDGDSRPSDCDCYSDDDVQRWRDDEWFYGGLVASVWIDDVCIDDHAASLWSIDCNFGKDNAYLDDVAADLIAEIDFDALAARLAAMAAKAAA